MPNNENIQIPAEWFDLVDFCIANLLLKGIQSMNSLSKHFNDLTSEQITESLTRIKRSKVLKKITINDQIFYALA